MNHDSIVLEEKRVSIRFESKLFRIKRKTIRQFEANRI